MSSYYEKFLATGEVKCIDDEIPFEIPQGWEWCRLKHMCSMQAGKNISASEIYDEKSVLHPYRCVGGNGLRGFTNTFNAEGHFAIIGRQGALCGCLNMESGKFYATEHAVVVNGFGIIPSLFIYYFFTALNLNQYATATAQPGLAVSNIVEVFIPLPPLPEQLRIVSKIEKLLPLVKTYEQAQNGLNELNASLNEQLRKSILQEAIQGKLVPQIAEEGTAEKLLTEISEEKERLIKEGKLKKSALTDSIIFKGDDNKYYEQVGKKCLDITEQIPFETPKNWVWTRLSHIANIYTGNSISETEKKSKFTDVIGRYYIGTKDVDFNNRIIYDNGIAIPKQYEPDFRLAPNNSILMCIEGGSAGRKIAILNQDVCFGNKLCCFSPFVGIGKYMYYYLQSPSFFELFNLNKTGIIGGVSIAKVKEILIPLPPIKEQQRIVAQIEKLFEQLR